MSVPAKILDGISKAIKGLFNVRTPVFLIKAVTELLPVVGIPEFTAGRRKPQFTTLVVRIQIR
jgi:hypothetical protein